MVVSDESFQRGPGTEYVPAEDLDSKVFEDQKKSYSKSLMPASGRGGARSIIMKHSKAKDVYSIWTDLLDYYDDTNQLSQLIIALSTKVQCHKFTSTARGEEYVEEFELLCQDLEDLGDPFYDVPRSELTLKRASGIRNIAPLLNQSYSASSRPTMALLATEQVRLCIEVLLWWRGRSENGRGTHKTFDSLEKKQDVCCARSSSVLLSLLRVRPQSYCRS